MSPITSDLRERAARGIVTEQGMPRVITEPLGGSPLAQAAARGDVPTAWYPPRPGDADAWRQRAREVGASAPAAWLDALRPAFGASASVVTRLEAVVAGNGVVVTTGQQPGLFGGPIYTWSKALSAIALAQELEMATGVPTVPVFWAATDDADFAEASWTMVARSGGADALRLPGDHAGIPMSSLPLGDVSALVDALERAAASAAWRAPLEMVRKAYRSGQTVGSAYLALLRAMLEPLGMAVLDAAHPAVRTAGAPLLREALKRGETIAARLADRDAELIAAGHTPQVVNVEGLALVFRMDGATRDRVRFDEASAISQTVGDDGLSPNVLLRPVMERAVLPTVAYVAGPAEIAYFAQVSAVADSVGAARPLAVPRWSCTILEPHVERILARFELTADDLEDPHAAESRLAMASLPSTVTDHLARLEESIESALTSLERDASMLVDPRAVDGARRSLAVRLARLRRRYMAAAKRRMTDVVRDIATARGSLFPAGKRQERALNLMPLLARYGEPLLRDMQGEARAHAAALVDASRESRPSPAALGATSPAP